MKWQSHQCGTWVATPLAGILAVIGCLWIAGCADDPAPPSPLDEYRYGVAAQRAGDRPGAIEHFQNAVRLDPTLVMANSKLAELYRAQGDYVQAARQYEVATQLDPYSAANQYYLGVCYQFLRRFQEAVGAYLKALNLQPTDVRANMNLGLVYLALGQTQAADACLQRATKLDPTSGNAWLNYGVSLDSSGRLSDAENAYRHALELQSGLTIALEDLTGNLIAQKKANEATTACEQLLLRSDTAVSRTRYGQALALRNDDVAAAKQFDLALARDPNSFIALSAKGFFLIDQYRKGMELNEPQRLMALSLWRKSLSINPNQPRVQTAIDKWKSSQLIGG